MTHFDAPRDRQLRLGSWMVGLILAGVAVGVLVLGLALSGRDLERLWPFLIAPAAIGAVVAAAWLLAPRVAFLWGLSPVRAEVAADAVRVERRWASAVELPLREVRSAEVMASADPGRSGAVRRGDPAIAGINPRFQSQGGYPGSRRAPPQGSGPAAYNAVRTRKGRSIMAKVQTRALTALGVLLVAAVAGLSACGGEDAKTCNGCRINGTFYESCPSYPQALCGQSCNIVFNVCS